MGVLSFLGRKGQERLKQAEHVLAFIDRIVRGTKDIAEIRERIAEGAKRGDLDDVISWARGRDKRVEDFIEGRDGQKEE